MASGQVADSGQQAVAEEKLLPEKDLCFRVGEKAAGEKWFSGAARRYVGKILEIRHISSCGHGSCKRPFELKVDFCFQAPDFCCVMGLAKDPLN